MKDACCVELGYDDFLSLPDTDRLKQSFYGRIKAGDFGYYRDWPKFALPDIISSLIQVGRSLGTATVVVFSSVDQFIGAARLPADRVFASIEQVWRVVEQDLCLATPALCDGLLLGMNYYTRTGQYVRDGVYELEAWGRLVPSESSSG